MGEQYFHRVHQLSPTRLWINNPTPEEARKAIAAGAINCTTNPTYGFNQLSKEETKIEALEIVRQAIRESDDDSIAASLVQRRLVKRILEIFLPLSEKQPGREGFVSVQGDPFAESDPQHIIDEALRGRELGANFLAKIPVTKAGLAAIEALIPENIPIIATEIMGIAQAVAVCELYQKVSQQCGKTPPLFVTHITGIFDQHLKSVIEEEQIDIEPDILWQAGCIVARKQYQLFKERNYPGILLGGGARGLHHFTEMVGGDMHITINWKGTADKLIETDPPVVYRMETPAPQYVIDELLEKVPDFRKAYREDGLAISDFEGFGPVALFRSMFLKGWENLLKTIKEQRSST